MSAPRTFLSLTSIIIPWFLSVVTVTDAPHRRGEHESHSICLFYPDGCPQAVCVKGYSWGPELKYAGEIVDNYKWIWLKDSVRYSLLQLLCSKCSHDQNNIDGTIDSIDVDSVYFCTTLNMQHSHLKSYIPVLFLNSAVKLIHIQ